MEKSNNGKIFLGFVIGVLVMAVVGMAGYIIYDKNNNKVNDNNNQLENNNNNNVNNENNNKVEDNKIIELSLEDDFVKRAFNIHSNFVYGNELIDYFYSSNKMLFTNLPKGKIENIFIWQWLNQDLGTSKDDSFIYYNSSTVLNEWKKFVGPNMKFELYNDGEELSGYKFSSDGTLKKCLNCGWGDIGPLETTNTLLRATKTDDEIVLYEAVKFMEFGDDDSVLWYKDYNMTIPTTYDEKIDANYRFIYKNDGSDNYYFYGVERIKINENSTDGIVELSKDVGFVKKAFNVHSSFVSGSDLVDYFYGNNKFKLTDLPKDWITHVFVWHWLTDVASGTINSKESTITYSSSDVLNEWKNLFGSGYAFNLYNYSGDVGKFDKDGSFTTAYGIGVDEGFIETQNTLLKAIKSEEEIILYEAVKFVEVDTYTLKNTYYKDYNKTIPTTEDENIDANYKFIYKKDVNDNYYFYGVEKIK